MPSAALQVAIVHADRQARLGLRTAAILARLWRRTDPGRIIASWRDQLPQAVAALGVSQASAAAAAQTYVADLADLYGLVAAPVRLQPGAYAGIASDGRSAAGLLLGPAARALEHIAKGGTPGQAMRVGQLSIEMTTRTQVADAGRTATATAMAAQSQLTGYVRLVVGGTCSRCLILAGRRYKWNAGFLRHPACDCRHIPVAENAPGDISTDPRARFDAMSLIEQDRVFTAAGAEAIRTGADMANVVNARRGMQTAADGRLYTTEAAGRRPRLMPEQIFREAGDDRAEAIRLLRLHGYLRA